MRKTEEIRKLTRSYLDELYGRITNPHVKAEILHLELLRLGEPTQHLLSEIVDPDEAVRHLEDMVREAMTSTLLIRLLDKSIDLRTKGHNGLLKAKQAREARKLASAKVAQKLNKEGKANKQIAAELQCTHQWVSELLKIQVE